MDVVDIRLNAPIKMASSGGFKSGQIECVHFSMNQCVHGFSKAKKHVQRVATNRCWGCSWGGADQHHFGKGMKQVSMASCQRLALDACANLGAFFEM